jgi:ubiquinone/menaquinone biosynthesis C-methylase UbiE
MPTEEAYLQKLLSRLKPGSRILELGCGPGVPFTKIIAESHDKGLEVTAVDVSASQMNLAQESVNKHEFPNVKFIRADMTEIGFTRNYFDAVVAFYTWFHLPREEQASMAERITRWLKPGGILLFNTSSVAEEIVWQNWMGVNMYINSLGVKGTLDLLREHGKELEVTDEIVSEKVGNQEENFHWIWAVKRFMTM